MRTRIKEVQGIDWFDGAIMNCRWDGPRLRDILLRAGVRYDREENRNDGKEYHVQFASHSQKTSEEDWYGGSIPLDRALAADKDVILAVKVYSRAFIIDALQWLKLTPASSGIDEWQPPPGEAWVSGQGYRAWGSRRPLSQMGR